MEVAVVLEDGEGDPVVADYPVVDEQNADDEYLHGDAECGDLDHPDFDHIKSSFQRLDG